MDSTAARDQALALARTQALDAAEELFYGRGVQAVGMDDVRGASGVSLKRLYQLFPSKELLVEAYLERRDVRWRRHLAEYVERREDPAERVLAVFDWLEEWFAEPGFRGCAWINSYGELGATSPRVAAQVRAHKQAFKGWLTELVADAGRPASVAGQVYLLAEGAMVTAGVERSPAPAVHAREAARVLLNACR
ncbi:TetR/AcrR family transcriptional regulator [Streptomyces sp. NPDC054842]